MVAVLKWGKKDNKILERELIKLHIDNFYLLSTHSYLVIPLDLHATLHGSSLLDRHYLVYSTSNDTIFAVFQYTIRAVVYLHSLFDIEHLYT